jgi:hypothetical protein
MGLQAFPNPMTGILNEIISERYENGSIIVTSNRLLETSNITTFFLYCFIHQEGGQYRAIALKLC